MLFADHPPSEHPSSPLFRAAENCSWRLLISYPRFLTLCLRLIWAPLLTQFPYPCRVRIKTGPPK